MLAATSRTTRFGVSFCSFIDSSIWIRNSGRVRTNDGNDQDRRERTPPVCSHLLHPRSRERRNAGRDPHCQWLRRAAERGTREVRRQNTTGPTAAQIPALRPWIHFFQPILRLWPNVCFNEQPPKVGKFRSLGPPHLSA